MTVTPSTEIDNFLNVVAETVLVEQVIRMIRMTWDPTGPRGPQFGEWEKHLNHHKMIVQIIKKEIKAEKSEA